MGLRKKRYRRKNKLHRRTVLVMGISFFAMLLFIKGMLAMLGGGVPTISEDLAEEYRKAAQLAGCTWQELVVYDTVRLDGDLKNADPYVSAVDFIKMYYEIWKYTENGESGYWALVSSGILKTSEDLLGWLGIEENSGIDAVMEASKPFQRPEFVLQFSTKELDALMLEKQFDEKDIQWADKLMTSGILDQMFNEVYDLPEYIETAEKGYFEWPTPALHVVTSEFAAARKHPVFGITRPHNGVDISGAEAMGSPVVAIDAGIVIQVNLDDGERGTNIRIQHCIGDDVWISRYQHLSAAKVTVGESVEKGMVIGDVGNTGVGTGSHLHLELTYNGVLIDPLPLIQ